MRFLLGTHRPNWLEALDVPLFVSHRTLAPRKRLPRARGDWALDSGAFTQLKDHGRFTMTADEYAEAVQRYGAEIGRLLWAAPMDWMCEPWIVQRTELSVREHQERTVANYLDLRDRGPFIPVLQGWALADYERCLDLYASAGVDLTRAPLVGVGSVCRRQRTAEIGWIFRELTDAGIRCHGFGVKKDGLARFGRILASADSMAWSFDGRYIGGRPGCHRRSHQNCIHHALSWRAQVLATFDQMTLSPYPPTRGRVRNGHRGHP